MLRTCRSLYSEGVDLERECALQVAGLVLVDHTALRKLVDPADDAGQLFTGLCGVGQRPEVADGISGGLTLIPVACPALGYLTDILLRSLMICHVLSFRNFRTAKLWIVHRITKSIRIFRYFSGLSPKTQSPGVFPSTENVSHSKHAYRSGFEVKLNCPIFVNLLTASPFHFQHA